MPTIAEYFRAETQTSILLDQLQSRFGKLPGKIRRKVETAEPGDVAGWLRAIVVVDRLEDVFDGSASRDRAG